MNEEQLVELLSRFVNAGSWAESRSIVEDNPALLTPEAEEMLGLIAAHYRDDVRIVQMLAIHSALLARCREKGINAAFSELEQLGDRLRSDSEQQGKEAANARAQQATLASDKGDAWPSSETAEDKATEAQGHLLRVAGLQALFDAKSVDSALAVVANYPILLTDRGLSTLQTSILVLRNAEEPEAMDWLETAEHGLDFILKLRKLTDDRPQRTVQAAIQSLASSLTVTSSSVEVEALLDQYSGLLFTDGMDRFLTSVGETMTANQFALGLHLTQSHQGILRYLRSGEVSYPLLTIFDEHSKREISLPEAERRLAVRVQADREEAQHFFRVLGLYLPRLCKLQPRTQALWLNLYLSLADAFGEPDQLVRGVVLITSQYKAAEIDHEGCDLLERALSIVRRVNVALLEYMLLVLLASFYKRNGEVLKAIESYEQAASVARAENNSEMEEAVVGDIGHLYSELLLQPEKGIEFHRRALEMARSNGDLRGMAARLHSMALDYRQLGNPAESIRCSRAAISQVHDLGEREPEANYLLALADTLYDTGDVEAAIAACTEAEAIFESLGDVESAEGARDQQDRFRMPTEARDLYRLAVSIKNGAISLDDGLREVQSAERLAEFSDAALLATNRYIGDLGGQDLELSYILASLTFTVAQTLPATRLTQIRCAVELADHCDEMGNYPLSMALYRSVLPDLKQYVEPVEQAAFYSNFGNTLLSSGAIAEGISFLEQARTLFAQIDPWSEANSLNRLGRSYLSLRDYEQARAHFEAALSICPTDFRRGLLLRGMLLGNMTVATLLLEDDTAAEAAAQEAVAIFRQLEMADDLRVAEARLVVLDFMRTVPASQRQAMISTVLGKTELGETLVRAPKSRLVMSMFEIPRLIDSGHWEEAETLLQQAISIGEVTGYDGNSVSCLHILAELRRRQGRLRESLVLFDQFLTEAQRVLPSEHYEHAEASLQNEIGLVYSGLGEHEKAIQHFEFGLAYARKVENRTSELVLLGNLEGAYRTTGRTEQSLAMLDAGLQLARELQDEDEENAFLGQLGTYYGDTNQPLLAIQFLEQAVTLARRRGDLNHECKWLDNLGLAQLAAGRLTTEAETSFQQALATANAAGNNDVAWRSLRSLAELAQRRSDFALALEHYAQAVELLEDLRLRQPSGPYRRRFLAKREVRKIYQNAIACCLALGYTEQGFAYAEKQRARSLAEELQIIDLAPRNVPPELLAEFEKLYSEAAEEDAILSLGGRDAQAAITPTIAGPQLSNLLGEQLFLASTRQKFVPTQRRPNDFVLQRLQAQRAELLERIRVYDPTYVYSSAAEIVDEHAVYDLLQDMPGTAIVEFNVGDGGSCAFQFVAGRRVEVVQLPDFNLETLGKLLVGEEGKPGWLVAQLAYAWQPDETTRQLWFAVLSQTLAQLYSQLFAPVTARLQGRGVTHLILAPHLQLGIWPLHAAYNAATHRLLVDEFEVSYTPSCAVLHRCRQRLQRLSTHSAGLLAFANPTLDLPFAGQEVAAIARHFTFPKVLQGSQCQVNNLLSATQNTFWHFAGHAVHDFATPMESALLFYGSEQDGRVTPQKLGLAQIFQDLRLPSTRLVTLSACQTGLSDLGDFASEFIGLATGLLHAGAPGVVSSLWTVNDLSTSLLMEQFYNGLIDQRLQPAAALRGAMLWLRAVTADDLARRYDSERRRPDSERDLSYADASAAWRRFASLPPNARPFAHPHFWAPFTLTGL